MRAKRRLIDTHSLSCFLCLSLSLSFWVRLCRRALLSADLQLLIHSEFFKVQFSKTVFLTVLRAWIAAHLLLRSLSCRTGTQRSSKGTWMRSIFVLPILSMFASDKLTNYSHSHSVAVGVLSCFATDRLTKLQSQGAVSDLDTVLMLNWKQAAPPFSSL